MLHVDLRQGPGLDRQQVSAATVSWAKTARKRLPVRQSFAGESIDPFSGKGRTWIAAMDEVGRGALAGPVSGRGGARGRSRPDRAARRARLQAAGAAGARAARAASVRRWAPAYAVGHAGPDEVDALGIMTALRAEPVSERWPSCRPYRISSCWTATMTCLTDPNGDGLFALLEGAPTSPPVRTLVKADLKCSSVAAASVLAKVERDALMIELHPQFPRYAWADNKGYSAPGASRGTAPARTDRASPADLAAAAGRRHRRARGVGSGRGRRG